MVLSMWFMVELEGIDDSMYVNAEVFNVTAGTWESMHTKNRKSSVRNETRLLIIVS